MPQFGVSILSTGSGFWYHLLGPDPDPNFIKWVQVQNLYVWDPGLEFMYWSTSEFYVFGPNPDYMHRI